MLMEKYESIYSLVKQDDEFYYLYKHLRIDEELRVLGIFENNKLLYTKPSAFNDPYDCVLKIDFDFSKIRKCDIEDALNLRITNKEFNSNKEKYIRELRKLPYIKNWGELHRNLFFVTCFNNNPLNILMWSHYTNNHEGFMIEFKFKKIKGIYNNLPLPVIYNDEFPILKVNPYTETEYYFSNENSGAELLIKSLLNKASVWEYEQEFRLTNKEDVTLENTKVLMDFEPHSIASVVFGPKIKLEHKKKIENAVKEFNKKHKLNVETFQAMLDRKCYRLAVPKHPRLKN